MHIFLGEKQELLQTKSINDCNLNLYISLTKKATVFLTAVNNLTQEFM